MSHTSEDSAYPPGLDLERLRAWLADAVPGVSSPLRATVIAGGRSNLTYAVSSGEQRWVVRRPPLGHVLATAHDMKREYRVMTALRSTPVPVPLTMALCEGTDVVGAPFYVMEHVRGTPYRARSELALLGHERTRAISVKLVDALGALHRVDPVEIGLGDLGQHEGYLSRQVRRWKKQLDASHSRDLPGAEELHARLATDIPTESDVRIVHGDFRLDNLLVDSDHGDEVTAVLDWEMATLGDPLSDLALMLMYHRLGAVIEDGAITDVSTAPGFLSEAEVIERYGAVTGRDLHRLGFYLGLSAFKLAAILEGIHYRYLHGQTVGDGFAHLGDAIHLLIDAGLDALQERC